MNEHNKLSLVAIAIVVLGCGSTDDTEQNTDADAGADAGAATNPAIMLAGQVYNPDGYLTYVGVFPDVPEGDVNFAKFREFGNANAYTFAGYVFVEEDGTMTRFSVNEQLDLVNERSFSWIDFGVAEINSSYNVFVSERRAYNFAPELGVVIVWDPETMKMTGTLPLDVPERPAGMSTYAYDGHLVGDKVIWNVISDDWDAGTIYPSVTLAIADAHADNPVRFVEDDRCVPGGPARVDEHGDYYVHAGAEYGYFAAYGEPDARTCMLRVKAGETRIDPDFIADYKELIGSPVSYPWVHVTGSQWLTYSWDPEVPLPENSDEFWDNAAFRPLLVDTEEGTARPYPDVKGGKQISGIQYNVDGTSYFEFSKTGYIESGNTDVVALHPEGTVKKFHLSGFLIGLERIR